MILVMSALHIPKILDINCRFFGIIHYNCDFKNKKWSTVFALLAPLPTLCLFFYSIYKSLQAKDSLQYSYVLVLFSNWANYLVKHFWYFIQKNNIKKLIKELDLFEEKHGVELGEVKADKTWLIFFNLIYYVYISISCIWLINKSARNHYFTFTIPGASNVLELMYHSVLLSHIAPRFKLINKKFKKYCFIIEMEQKTYPKKNHNMEQIENMEKLSIIQCELSKIVVLADELLTLPFLLTFSSYLAMLIDRTYDLVKKCLKQDFCELSFFINYLQWTFSIVLNLVMVIKIWNTIALKANKTSAHVHEIWNTYSKNKLVDSNVTHLTLISTRLMNTKLNITAFGFFKIDWALFHLVAATLTTYLIILMQLGH